MLVTSTENKGALFQIALPIKSAEGDAVAPLWVLCRRTNQPELLERRAGK
jgi:hypothetical protein